MRQPWVAVWQKRDSLGKPVALGSAVFPVEAMSEKTAEKRGPIRTLYAWMMKHAQGKHAWRALACFAFAEASCFPIPPDVMLLPMMLADRKRALKLAAWCAGWSIIGGMLGYLIGYALMDSVGQWIIHALHIPQTTVDNLCLKYSAHAYWIAIQGLTPIPFKLVTISAGLAKVPFAAFLFFAALARSVRFVVIEGLLVHYFGDRAKHYLEKYLEPALIGFLVLVVLGFVLMGYLAK
jgi:membrane protein YqaA with SNARE-associated domain